MIGSWGALHAAVTHLCARPTTGDRALDLLLASVHAPAPVGPPPRGIVAPAPDDDVEADRLRALVDLARGGDAEAFGQLYDHYVRSIYRFVAYRVGSRTLAEDITSETFTRALRSIAGYQWQGKDFGAWLTTIARNLVTDHYKSSRSRLEVVADEIPEGARIEQGPEDEVLTSLTNETLMAAVRALPDEQRDCLLMRFVQNLSIAQTAEALGRTEGAVKQLQLRAVRRLARDLPPEAIL